ncbi:MAG: phosphopantothenate--cysteine ligase [Enterococcus sp.]
MRILITAGGTSERIDQVRSITNHSTGRLGKTIAASFTQSIDALQIDYVTTKRAVLPQQTSALTFYFIESTTDLLSTLKQLMTTHTYDVVIHSMAVSDFTPAVHLNEHTLLDTWRTHAPTTTEEFDVWLDTLQAAQEKATKIGSADAEHLILVLNKTPKIIQFIRTWQPQTILVGFKLLVDVSKEHLLDVARENLKKNQADFTLANDLTEITDAQHHGYLVAANGEITEGNTKQELAEQLVQAVLSKKESFA